MEREIVGIMIEKGLMWYSVENRISNGVWESEAVVHIAYLGLVSMLANKKNYLGGQNSKGEYNWEGVSENHDESILEKVVQQPKNGHVLKLILKRHVAG